MVRCALGGGPGWRSGLYQGAAPSTSLLTLRDVNVEVLYGSDPNA